MEQTNFLIGKKVLINSAGTVYEGVIVDKCYNHNCNVFSSTYYIVMLPDGTIKNCAFNYLLKVIQ